MVQILCGISKEIVETTIACGNTSINAEVIGHLKTKPWYKYYRDYLDAVVVPTEFDPASLETGFKNELRIYVRRLITSSSLKKKDKNNEIPIGSQVAHLLVLV
jgi:hypothetical protein